MNSDVLSRREVRALWLWVAAGVVGALVAFRFFFAAFPEAAVDFRVSRPAAVEVARGFLAKQGFPLQGYDSSIVFSFDADAKTYLEREVGLEQANRLMASEVNVWHWDVRFFRPQKEEEFRVRVDPAGRVVGLSHKVEEAAEGASLERDAARALAEGLLAQLTDPRTGQALAPDDYDYLSEEANSTDRPKRRDWSFTWERRGFKAKDAPYRLQVTVQGGRADGYREFLKVPEAWQRDFERLRSSNLFYQNLAQVPFIFLQGAVFLLLFQFGRRGQVRWGGALRLGAILSALFFLMNANSWPLTRHDYDTNSVYAGFFLWQMVLALLGSALAGIVVSLTVAAGDPLYRQDHPGKLRLGAVLTRDGLRSKEFFSACVVGLAMAAAHIGFVVLFYLLGKNVGFWAPQDIKYTDAVSTALPWIYPLAISLYAATSEEFLFRLFAIPLLLRWTRSKFAAVVVPALIWGFLHSAYPQQPGYVRGIEVGLIGIVAGWVMLRWGIVATLAWHYTVDALLIGLFLLRSESLYFLLSGIVVVAAVLFPLAFAGYFYFARRRFADAQPLLNLAAPLPAGVEEQPAETAAAPVAVGAPPLEVGGAPAEPAVVRLGSLRLRSGQAPLAAPAARFEPVPSNRLKLAVAAGALGILFYVAVKPEAIGDFLKTQLHAGEASERADQVLRRRGVDPGRYRSATTLISTFDGFANEFLRRKIGIPAANRLYQEKVPSAFWHVRYFRDLEKEEYRVVLLLNGEFHSVHHALEEKAPGANLTKEEAQARAQAFLRDEKKLRLEEWKLVESTSDKRPARTDHTFTWELASPVAGSGETDAAHVRVELKVQGDEVSGYRIFVKIPEEWRRKQSEQTLASIARTLALVLFFVALAITCLVLFLKNLKHPAAESIPWRRLSRWALWAALAMLTTVVLGWDRLLTNYPTEMPFRTFIAVSGMSSFILLATAYSGVFILFGLAWFYLARAYGSERVPSWRGMPREYYRDAFLLALAGAGVLRGLSRLAVLAERYWPTAKKSLGASVPTGVESHLPAALAMASAVVLGLFVVGVVGLAAGFISGYLRGRSVQAGLILLGAALMAGNWGDPADLAKSILLGAVWLTTVWLGIARVFRWNMLAYFLLPMTLALSGAATQLLSQPNGFLRWNGAALVVVVVAVLAWPLVTAAREPASRTQTEG